MVGIGGAFLSVPFMTRCNVKMHSAVATSAALGLPIAVAATVGFVLAGLRKTGLPPYSIGYVYLPALVAIVVTSTLLAPLGARAAHAMPVARLRYAFVAMLVRAGRVHVVEGVPPLTGPPPARAGRLLKGVGIPRSLPHSERSEEPALPNRFRDSEFLAELASEANSNDWDS